MECLGWIAMIAVVWAIVYAWIISQHGSMEAYIQHTNEQRARYQETHFCPHEQPLSYPCRLCEIEEEEGLLMMIDWDEHDDCNDDDDGDWDD